MVDIDPGIIIVVQHIPTSFYFQGKSRWTLRIEDAFRFGSVQEARQFCDQRNAKVLQIVLRKIFDCPEGGGTVRLADPSSDVRLRPFKKPVSAPALNTQAADDLAVLLAKNKALREKQQRLVLEIDSLGAEGKEGRKRYPFKPKQTS